jgi:hypothetical protein
MKLHNTPSLITPPVPPKTQLDKKALLYKLEDDYRDYREAVENRLCKSDPSVHAMFKAKIEEAMSTLSHPV